MLYLLNARRKGGREGGREEGSEGRVRRVEEGGRIYIYMDSVYNFATI